MRTKFSNVFKAQMAALALMAVPLTAAANELTRPVERIAMGEQLYAANCSTCHGKSGRGSSRVPPLAGSEWVVGPSEPLIKIVNDGLSGPIHVSGKVFDSEMPSFRFALGDEEVPSILTFVRQAWGNSTNEPIATEEVINARAKVRDRAWTACELCTNVSSSVCALQACGEDGKRDDPGPPVDVPSVGSPTSQLDPSALPDPTQAGTSPAGKSNIMVELFLVLGFSFIVGGAVGYFMANSGNPKSVRFVLLKSLMMNSMFMLSGSFFYMHAAFSGAEWTHSQLIGLKFWKLVILYGIIMGSVLSLLGALPALLGCVIPYRLFRFFQLKRAES